METKLGMWMCPNCHRATLVTFDSEERPTYKHITFEWKDGIEQARLACDPTNLLIVSRTEAE